MTGQGGLSPKARRAVFKARDSGETTRSCTCQKRGPKQRTRWSVIASRLIHPHNSWDCWLVDALRQARAALWNEQKQTNMSAPAKHVHGKMSGCVMLYKGSTFHQQKQTDTPLAWVTSARPAWQLPVPPLHLQGSAGCQTAADPQTQAPHRLAWPGLDVHSSPSCHA